MTSKGGTWFTLYPVCIVVSSAVSSGKSKQVVQSLLKGTYRQNNQVDGTLFVIPISDDSSLREPINAGLYHIHIRSGDRLEETWTRSRSSTSKAEIWEKRRLELGLGRQFSTCQTCQGV